jgi:NitT/TauT family transport system substrate-binding protein
MKKIISAILMIILASASLANCAKESPPPDSGAQSSAIIRVASLKGPTTIGLVKLLDDAERGDASYSLESNIYGAADEITGLISSGDFDVAAIPANLAAVLYNKLEGGPFFVAAINTLGVLYVLENGDAIQSVADLKGKTIYSTGKGTTPEFALNSLLRWNGIDPEADVTIEYKSEAGELAALLESEGENAIAVLPQPYVTSVLSQNPEVRIALDITEEWQAASGKTLITGVTVVRREFAQDNPEALAAFLADYRASVEWVNANPADASLLVEKYGIVAKAALAEKAIPGCNVAYIDGDAMAAALGDYLGVLFEQNPQSVGGALPDEGFYKQA